MMLGHNILYIVVGFIWLSFVSPRPPGEEDITIREDAPQRYEFAAMLCGLLFAHNLLERIEGKPDVLSDILRPHAVSAISR